jgi:lipoprotein NlpD
MRPAGSVWLLALLLVGLAGCATQPPVPIDLPQAPQPVARPERPPPPPVSTVTVRRGDTLYAIAFARGLDFRDVARWNGIVEPFTIYPGQVLRLGPTEAGAGVAAVPEAATAATPTPAPAPGPAGETSVRVVGRVPAPPPATGGPVFVPLETPASPGTATLPPAGAEGSAAATVADRTARPGASPPPPAAAATQAPTGAKPAAGPEVTAVTPSASTGAAVADGTKTVVARSEAPKQGAAAGAWLWPTDGKILEAFGSGGRKGIVVGGQSGQPIRAARAGEVVYAGGGLLGYGLLVIVKHDDTFLSAYGNNSRLLVKEGARVEAGQSIAEMGASADGRVGLHFELRRKGQPIDPLTLVQAP